MEQQEVLLTCPICSWPFSGHSYGHRVYPTNSGDDKISNKPHSILFCGNCEVGIAFPQLTESRLIALYSKGNFWKNLGTGMLMPKNFPGHYALAQARWNSIAPFIKKNIVNKAISILDVGAGHGFFGMVAARNRNVYLEKYCAVEKDPILRKSLKKSWDRYFPKIKLETKESLGDTEGEYNFIVFSNILEHLNTPKSILKAAMKRLTKNGFVFIDVPNQDYIFKKDVFPHLLFFNKRSLETLFKETGLVIRHISCYGKSMIHSPINYKNDKKMLVRISRILYKIRSIIPSRFSRAFFTYYFGSDKENVNGTWLCALGQRCIRG